MSARSAAASPGTATSAVRTGATLMAAAGLIAASGLAVLLLAVYGVRAGQVWAWVAAVPCLYRAGHESEPTTRDGDGW
jgi:hypothetical protein